MSSTDALDFPMQMANAITLNAFSQTAGPLSGNVATRWPAAPAAGPVHALSPRPLSVPSPHPGHAMYPASHPLTPPSYTPLSTTVKQASTTTPAMSSLQQQQQQQQFLNPTTSNPPQQQLTAELIAAIVTQVMTILQPMLQQVAEAAVNSYVQRTNSAPVANNTAAVNMRKQIRKQTYLMDRMEQVEKQNNIRMKGITYAESEDTAEKVIELAQSISVTLDRNDFTCYRTGNIENASRPVMVRLHKKHKKIELMKAKKHLARGKTIEEDLTRLRSKLYYTVRKSENTIKHWTIDGKIFAVVKSNDGSDPSKVCFETPDDLYVLGYDEDRLEQFMNTV